MLKKILVPVQDHLPFETEMSFAASFSKEFDANIEFAHCRPTPEDFLPHGLPMPDFLKKKLIEQAKGYADFQEADLKRQYEDLFDDLAKKTDYGQFARSKSTWHEFQGKPADTIRERGRLADLIVVPKPARDRSVDSNTLVSSIFNTGRPVLMCPQMDHPAQSSLVNHVCIAWNGSLFAARAVALCMPILRKAAKVTVLTANVEEAHGASAGDLSEYLAMRDIKAEFERFQPRLRVGDALMERQRSLGSDLMIMGAYSVGHHREAIFGGTTQNIVDRADLPAIFVH
jgi:nucleotide-binding universal stress UspA family protein